MSEKAKQRTPYTGWKHSDESKKIISEKAKQRTPYTGWTHTEESKQKMSESIRNRPNAICPYCKKEAIPSLIKRWHGDNCKYKK